MTTLYQFYKCIQNQILNNPDSANYEVNFVDESTQTEIGTTPVGLNPFIGCWDDLKKFDFFCNIPKDTVDEYMKNRMKTELNYFIDGNESDIYKRILDDENRFIEDIKRVSLNKALFE